MAENLLIDLHDLRIARLDLPRQRILRVRRMAEPLATSLGTAFGLAWPVAANTVSRSTAARIFWLSPVEWLIADGETPVPDAAISAACADAIHHLADVTDARAAWRIAGAHATALLNTGCSLDLHRRSFPQAGCAQTLLAQLSALVWRCEGGFDVQTDASYRTYFEAWLSDAAREFPVTEASAK